MKSFDSTCDLVSRKHGEIPLQGESLIGFIGAVLERSAAFRFKVKGFSMWPFIKDEDIVTIEPLQAVRPRLGDVAAFVHPESKTLVIHRIIGKRGDDYLMKGDNALMKDGAVSRAHILGRVKKVERGGKEISLGLGPERVPIALLMRSRFLFHMLLRLCVRIFPKIGSNRFSAKRSNKKE